jgi:ubiquinone/menaquinone biosynthesis C-methylase UbiE
MLSAAGLLAQVLNRHPVSGRVIAPVMGVGGATWLERAERESEESPRTAIKMLELRPGMSVADVGAGSGYYTELLAGAVGPEGRIYATDIQPGMVRLVEQRVQSRKLAQVQPILAPPDGTGLAPECCDVILMVDVYHELSNPQSILRQLKLALKTEGRLVLLEFRKEDRSVPIREEHKMSIAEARIELESEGYRFEGALPGLPWQHMLVFRKQSGSGGAKQK